MQLKLMKLIHDESLNLVFTFDLFCSILQLLRRQNLIFGVLYLWCLLLSCQGSDGQWHRFFSRYKNSALLLLSYFFSKLNFALIHLIVNTWFFFLARLNWMMCWYQNNLKKESYGECHLKPGFLPQNSIYIVAINFHRIIECKRCILCPPKEID